MRIRFSYVSLIVLLLVISSLNKLKYFQSEVSHVLCQPVVQPDGQLASVLMLWRNENGGKFHEEDEEIACSYLVWGGIALHYAHLYLNMNQQRKLNDFLLAVVK